MKQQQNNNNNKVWFTIILAMWIVLLITLLALLILEYIIPFSKNVKGIENSSNAYYEANSWIEEALWFRSQNDIGSESWSLLVVTDSVSNSFQIEAQGDILPPAWKWNSEDGSDWNRIAQGQPIQLTIWNDLISTIPDWDWIEFFFRIPDIDGSSTQNLQWSTGAIINWQLSWNTNSLNSYNSYVTYDDIDWNPINFSEKQWIDLNWVHWDPNEKFANFHNSNCTWSWSGCILKLSVINDLVLNDSTPVPYLEWQINFNGNVVPLRYANIESSGKSYWFKKNLEVKIPQQTVIEAFDFTIFQ